MYGNGESSCDDECSSQSVDFKTPKLLFSIGKQSLSAARHLDFHNPFPNGRLARLVYIELPKQVSSDSWEHYPSVEDKSRSVWCKEYCKSVI